MIKINSVSETRYLLFFMFIVLLGGTLASCYKDKGNYQYTSVQHPIITNLDSVYHVYVGDSLNIVPGLSIPGLDDSKLSFMWTIQVPPDLKGDTNIVFHTKDLRMIFGLGAKTYTARFVVNNEVDAMKYFYDVKIMGKTAFSEGLTVLTDDNGVTKLSFIKPNDSIQPGIFQAVNPGQILPSQPTQILAVPQAYQPPVASYWIFGKSGLNTGIQIDANTFKTIRTFSENFFSAPDTALVPQSIFVNPLGVISGNVNGRLYNGTTSTYNLAPTYGMFGGGAVGDYLLSPEVVFNYEGTFGPGNYIGFDLKTRAFVRFNLYGDASYFGTSYDVIGNDFNPKNTGMDLIHLQQVNGGLCYAYFKAANDSLFEVQFNAEFNGPFQMTIFSKRPFAKPDLINENTLWAATQNGVMYFNYQDKIYRYNPLNQDFKVLNTEFGGKAVTMIKIMDQNTLVAGIDGSVFYLDISMGQLGTRLKEIHGLPGKVIDIAFRKQ